MLILRKTWKIRQTNVWTKNSACKIMQKAFPKNMVPHQKPYIFESRIVTVSITVSHREVTRERHEESLPMAELYDSESNLMSNQQNVCSIFDEIEKSINRYYQSAIDLQCECAQYYRDVFGNVMSMDQDITKSGMCSPFDVLQKTLDNYLQATGMINTIQNQLFITITEALRQNLKSLNKNSTTPVDLVRLNMQLWQSFLSSKQE